MSGLSANFHTAESMIFALTPEDITRAFALYMEQQDGAFGKRVEIQPEEMVVYVTGHQVELLREAFHSIQIKTVQALKDSVRTTMPKDMTFDDRWNRDIVGQFLETLMGRQSPVKDYTMVSLGVWQDMVTCGINALSQDPRHYHTCATLQQFLLPAHTSSGEELNGVADVLEALVF